MKLATPRPVRELAKHLSAHLLGEADNRVTGINEIHHVEAGDITFVDAPKYYDKALRSAASVILIDRPADPPPGKTLLVVQRPFDCYNQLVQEERPFRPIGEAINPRARIGIGTTIEPGAIIADNVTIGDRCYIGANVVIHEHCIIGNDVVIQAGSIIGSDAFYFKRDADAYLKWRAGGRVVLEDQVDIGANCTINRGVSSDTVIGYGTKLDCQVQIGHDVKIGKRCLLAAQAGIAGNSVLEDEVVLMGQAGVAQNVRIGARALISAKSGVSKNLEGGKTYFGVPAVEASLAYRSLAMLRRLAGRGRQEDNA